MITEARSISDRVAGEFNWLSAMKVLRVGTVGGSEVTEKGGRRSGNQRHLAPPRSRLWEAHIQKVGVLYRLPLVGGSASRRKSDGRLLGRSRRQRQQRLPQSAVCQRLHAGKSQQRRGNDGRRYGRRDRRRRRRKNEPAANVRHARTLPSGCISTLWKSGCLPNDRRWCGGTCFRFD